MPLFQSESKCKTILMKMTLICVKMKLHPELIFIWKVSHLDLFWNTGTRELGNCLIYFRYSSSVILQCSQVLATGHPDNNLKVIIWFLYVQLNHTYRVNVKEKVVIAVVESFEQSLHLSERSSMKREDVCYPDRTPICRASGVYSLCRASLFTWHRARSFNINFEEHFGFR